MTNAYRIGLLWVVCCAAISVFWGISIGRSRTAWLDFRAVYAGTRCLIHGHNPYNVSDLEHEYLSEDGQRPSNFPWAFQTITVYINMPTAFIFVAPFAMLPWGAACLLWMLLTGVAFCGALFLMWDAGARLAPSVATILACLIAVNSEAIFCGGNTAGIVTGFCVIAVWCLLRDRMVWLGILCLGIGLAVKPHDVGFVWLYFMLAGVTHRKRALQSLLITAVIGLASILWVSRVDPHWMRDWSNNLITTSTHGELNDPSPESVAGLAPSSVIDLQAAISVFRNDPHFYNAFSYIVSAPLLLFWTVRVWRSRFSRDGAWLALAAVSALSMLFTYHRPWDAKLLLLAIPGCSLLWSKGGQTGKAAFWMAAVAAFCSGDISLTALLILYGMWHLSLNGILGKLLAVLLLRPASVALLAMGIFYLSAYALYLRRLQTDPTATGDV